MFSAKELGITQETVQLAIKKANDLKIQAMMFDMDIDIETWALVPKSTYREPFWLTNWKDKVNQGDSGAESPDQNLGEQ